ncbi:hypothetical protein V1504DRAFT_398722 [Lipomyces starkeyi]
MLRFLNVYTISAFAALGGVLLGFDISSMSGIISQDQYLTYYRNPLGVLQGAITSMMAAGSIVGAPSCGVITDYGRLSRRVCIQLGAALWIIGSIFQSTSNGVPMLIVGRVIAGLGIGMTSTLVPIYLSEIASRKTRGRIVSLQQFAITWGILIGFLVDTAARISSRLRQLHARPRRSATPAVDSVAPVIYIWSLQFRRVDPCLACRARNEAAHARGNGRGLRARRAAMAVVSWPARIEQARRPGEGN